jgi:hypothetical protein
VNFWLIVAAEPTNASEKLPSAASASAGASVGGRVGDVASASAVTSEAPKSHFFLAMKKI